MLFVRDYRKFGLTRALARGSIRLRHVVVGYDAQDPVDLVGREGAVRCGGSDDEVGRQLDLDEQVGVLERYVERVRHDFFRLPSVEQLVVRFPLRTRTQVPFRTIVPVRNRSKPKAGENFDEALPGLPDRASPED